MENNKLTIRGAEQILCHTDEFQQFLMVLNSEPPKDEIKINENVKGKPRYLPISFVQMKLDEIFFGLWKTDKFNFLTIANEMVGWIELTVFHPVLNEWITRTGSAGVLIRQKEGADLTDVSQKIKNGLTMDFPHLEAMCLLSAAKKFGKIFGRDLNRKFEDEYNPNWNEDLFIPKPIAQKLKDLIIEKGLNAKVKEFLQANQIERLTEIPYGILNDFTNYIGLQENELL